jgi:hypothetical protein
MKLMLGLKVTGCNFCNMCKVTLRSYHVFFDCLVTTKYRDLWLKSESEPLLVTAVARSMHVQKLL